ncbi:amino acid permease [Komagataeibacter sp. FNDCF1]|uniref:amino acid permease n=1 Tax=Komagataeibacter sp. FNDCF1 TaxID=2878681 RepID=UPI001E5A1205|nr:amino acid permease [Komagataeibacter sp. FNDCF1]MCE2563268.1 amino acid permease [Komagataeibacter sp. FNDCF1]
MTDTTSIPQPSSSGSRLKQRHIMMIALGGAIGAGLFVGSSAVIAAAGPAALLAFVAVGLLVMFIMRMLGEMVSANPGKGSFVEYIRAAHGNGAAFTAGWLYWFFWVVALGSEAIAGAILIHEWINLPVWVLAASLIIMLKLINLAAVHIFGECEFWLSAIKVVSIILFVTAGVLYIAHVFGPGAPVMQNLLGHGGFFPHGMTAMISIIPSILFTMIGSEIATVAAGESAEPARNVARVTRTIGIRLTLFNSLSIALILLIVPWSDAVPGHSPFVQALQIMGIPGAALGMKIVVLTAVLSCMNSSLYITSRVLAELARNNDAPAFLRRRPQQHSPVNAIIANSVVGGIISFSSILAPGTVFAFLLSCSGGVILLVYSLIVTSYLVLRRQATGREQQACFRIPFFPAINILTLGGVIVIFAAMFLDPMQRMVAIASLGTSIFFVLIHVGRTRLAGRNR